MEEEEVEITEASQAPGMGGGVAREETDSEAGARNEATTERLIADLRSQEWRSRTAVFYNMLKKGNRFLSFFTAISSVCKTSISVPEYACRIQTCSPAHCIKYRS